MIRRYYEKMNLSPKHRRRKRKTWLQPVQSHIRWRTGPIIFILGFALAFPIAIGWFEYSTNMARQTVLHFEGEVLAFTRETHKLLRRQEHLLEKSILSHSPAHRLETSTPSVKPVTHHYKYPARPESTPRTPVLVSYARNRSYQRPKSPTKVAIRPKARPTRQQVRSTPDESYESYMKWVRKTLTEYKSQK